MQFEKKNCLLLYRYAANTETNCLYVRRDLGNEPDNDPLVSGAVPKTDELFFSWLFFLFFWVGGVIVKNASGGCWFCCRHQMHQSG